MCGIAGIISINNIEKQCLSAMSNSLTHRGPDGFGYMLYSKKNGIKSWINKDIPADEKKLYTIGFAHRRLSIIDLSQANSQPKMDESGKYCIVYNGEIYNYIELKKELKSLGYVFTTTGDTEVLLHSYDAWGISCMEKFNGMWSFVLLDTKNEQIILSRDRFGIKPLYYAIHNNIIYFSSEIKGLFRVLTLTPKPNEKILAQYLITGLVDQTEETFFDGIYQFPAAHYAAISLRSKQLEIKPKSYWSVPETFYQGGEYEAVEEFRELLFDSIRVHARSDVPVGTCLSGGLDSSSIVCCSDILRKKNSIPMYSHNAFGYCSLDEWSEKKYMDIIKAATSVNMHYITILEEDFKKNLLQIINQQDEPFVSASIVAQWFVFRKAKERGIIVMLDGQGADEILGGYHHNFLTLALNLILKGDILGHLALRYKYKKEIGKFPRSYRFFLMGLLATVLPTHIPIFLRPFTQFMRKRARTIIHTGHAISPYTDRLIMQYQPEPSAFKHKRSLYELLKMQLKSTSLPSLLRYEDRNSMAHSVEARVPFLDYRLVNFLFQIPENLKIKDVTTKYILREAMKDILPEAIRTRKDKIGFQASPILTYSFVRNHYNDLFKNKTELEKIIFNPLGVKNLIEGYSQSNFLEFKIWRILNLKLWIRRHWG